MEANFKRLLPFKREGELQAYLDNSAALNPDELAAVISEFQGRGRVFTEEELTRYGYAANVQPAEEEQPRTEYRGNIARWKSNVVDDPAAPEYYSQQVIYIFSIVFSVLFGAILLVMNIARTREKRGVTEVISFGIGVAALQVFLASVLPQSATFLGLGCGIGGGIILNNFFWNKFLGRDTKYRTRSYVGPLIVGLVLSVIFIVSVIYTYTVDPSLLRLGR